MKGTVLTALLASVSWPYSVQNERGSTHVRGGRKHGAVLYKCSKSFERKLR